MTNTIRRHDIDWLRVLAFFLLIFFHAGMPFVTHQWHIDNSDQSVWLTHVWGFLHYWRLPLLFTISGMGVWFAFKSRGAGGFLKERLVRLLLPLTFGTLVIVPPQMYYQRMFEGAFSGSFLEFYPHFFDGGFPNGNFSPLHLWFVGYLLIYCFMAMPIFMFFKSKSGGRALDRVASVLGRDGGIYALIWPLFLGMVLLDPLPKSFWLHPVDIFSQLTLFIYGFVLCSRSQIWGAIERQRHVSLALAALGISAMYYMRMTPDYQYQAWQIILTNVIGFLSLLLAIFGYGKHHLGFKNRILTYCNEAVYPFYILHQTFTVAIVYHLVGLEMNMWIKFAITVLGTILCTWSSYHFLIRPYNAMRVLFGLKPKPGKEKVMVATPVVV